MKIKVLFVIVLVGFLASACSPKYDAETCIDAKVQVTTTLDLSETYAEYIESFERPLTGFEVNYILNTNHSPDSVGAILKECIENGWDGWRSEELND